MRGDVEETGAAQGATLEALLASASAERLSKLVETGRLLESHHHLAAGISELGEQQDEYEELRSEEGGAAAKRQLGKQRQEHSRRAGMKSPESPSREPAETPAKPPFKEKLSWEQKRVARVARQQGRFAQQAQFAYAWMNGLETRSFQGRSFPGEQSFRYSGLISKEQIEKIDEIYSRSALFDFRVPNPRGLDERSAPRLIERFERRRIARNRADRA